MKRRIHAIVMVLILSAVLPSFLLADVPYQKKIIIQGGYDDVGAINIVAVPAQSEQYKIGMPFSINDSSVYYGSSDKGRLIANWNVLANNQFYIDVEAEIMHHESENDVVDTGYDNGLGYILTFTYNLSYYSGDELFYIPERKFLINVPDSETSTIVKITNINLLEGVDLKPNSLVGSADGDIYFIFDQFTTDLVKNAHSSLLDGNYTASVKMFLKVK